MSSSLVRVLFGVFMGAIAIPAHAQSAQSGGPGAIRELRGSGATYEVAFDDDPLQALDGRGTVARIRVRLGPARTLLIRPRTSFVSSMLKSVEDM